MAESSGTSIRASKGHLTSCLLPAQPAPTFVRVHRHERMHVLSGPDLYHLDGPFILKKKERKKEIQNYLLQLFTKTQARGNISRAP